MILIGLAAEDASDARRIGGLVDRLLSHSFDWIEPATIDAFRQWCGVGSDKWLDIHHASRLATERGLRLYGHFRNEPGAMDAHMHRNILVLFADADDSPRAVVVGRDLDDEKERSIGFRQAAEIRDWPFAVIGALAQPEIEAWLVAAWTDEHEIERQRLEDLRREIGFDPLEESERLSNSETSARDAKRVLGRLTESGRSAGDRWQSAPIELLTRRGTGNGLAAFIDCVRRQVLPLFGRSPR